MSRANALRTLARTDPEAYLEAALHTGVLERAGFLRDDDGHLGHDVQWWPTSHPGRDPVYRAGPHLQEVLKAKAPAPAPTINEGSDCITGKAQYPTKAAARGHRDRLRAQGDATAKVYRCESCGCFHVGHTRREDKRRAVAR